MQLGAYQTNIHHFQSKIYTFFTESMFEKVSFSLIFNWFFTIYKAFLFYFKESELLWRAVSQKEKKISVSGKLKKKKKNSQLLPPTKEILACSFMSACSMAVLKNSLYTCKVRWFYLSCRMYSVYWYIRYAPSFKHHI